MRSLTMGDWEWRAFMAVLAVKAAHDEENTCSCPYTWGKCFLRNRWVKELLKKRADEVEMVFGGGGPKAAQYDGQREGE